VKFSIFEMMANAGLIVQFVMICLLLFSVVSWGIIISKLIMFRRARRDTEDFLDHFWESRNLNEAYEAADEFAGSPEAGVFTAGLQELRKIGRARGKKFPGEATLETQLAGLDNLKRTLRKSQSQELAHLGKWLPFLATTGSATPFIGLFGTVWGIMTSFHDIGMRGSASLAVVAPGISEALVATAAGLAVAIPAVIFYNFYSNKLAGVEDEMEHFSADFLNLIERDILTKG